MLVETDASANRLRSRPKSALIQPLRRLLGNTGPHPPWDDRAPIRAELFSVERLEEHARSLAAAQGVMAGERKGAPLAKRLAENEAELLSAYREIAKAVDAGAAITPAAEWLIDNFHLIEKQIREIRADLPAGYYRQLPKLASGPFVGYPRVFGATWALVAHTDSLFDPEILRRYLRAYQEVQPLTIGELWAVAITLRIVLIENLRRIAKRIADSGADRRAADALADRLLGAGGRAPEPSNAVLPQHPRRRTRMRSLCIWPIACAIRIPVSRQRWSGSTGNWRGRGRPLMRSSMMSTSGRSPAVSQYATLSQACASSQTSIGLSCSSASAWSTRYSRGEADLPRWISRRAIFTAPRSNSSPAAPASPSWRWPKRPSWRRGTRTRQTLRRATGALRIRAII